MSAVPAEIRDVARAKHIFMMLYGESGVGKTRLIGDSPGKTLIIRPPIEHTDSIRRTAPGLKEWVVHNWSEMNDVEEYLRHSGAEWDWVWLDSISLFQDTGLDDIWADTIARKPARKQFGLDKPEYGINMTRLGQWVRGAVGADEFNFGMTAHPFYGSTVTGEVLLMPHVQGKNMSNKMSGYMTFVAYYEIAAMKQDGEDVMRHVLRTVKTENYFAKDQYDAFLPSGRLVNPTMVKILEKIEASPARQQVKAATKKPAPRGGRRRKKTTIKR